MEQRTNYNLLSDRCKSVIDFMNKKSGSNYRWFSRAEIAMFADLSIQQVTCTFELLKKHGYSFDRQRMNKGSQFFNYRMSDKLFTATENMMSRSIQASNERLITDMNRIRMLAEAGGHSEILKHANLSLTACGLL